MTNIVDSIQDKMWESIQTLASVDSEQAIAVCKAAIERTLRQFDNSQSVSALQLSLPSKEDIDRLRNIEHHMIDARLHQNQKKTLEWLVEYVEQISLMSEDDSQTIRKKMLASLLLSKQRRKKRVRHIKLVANGQLLQHDQLFKQAAMYSTPNEIAKKLGLSDQTIRRMCEKGKFEGAYQTDGGHWKIPQDIFITTSEQDKEAEGVLRQVDAKNKEAGSVDEFDL